ncbi:probable 2-oxoglutarate-dependent dioxygenase AOP1 [Lycium ferocissimum]|uniref:probable 2-oxoglutarate-dependent dioxygenase AOP1 n=1 Tax=Lycium ferocissimum TaxID=112874 RepID=UPI0028150716|nr:probable 2-oxoglutarate-dependent dioxygenase AOP1 [Lycium ferocissimum]
MDKLPTIDFGKLELKPGSEEWISVREQVYRALEEYGLFEAILDGVPTQSLYEKIKHVFSFPLATKLENSKLFTGYIGGNPAFPLWEGMIFNHILNPCVIENFSNLLWPSGEPEFCDLVLSSAKRLREFDEMVRRMIFEKLGMEKYWDEHTKSITCSISFFKYRLPKKDEETKTILSQHQVSGLQFKTKNEQWLEVEYSSPNSFLFLANDCLKALPNGRLHSPYHQVIMGNREVYTKEGYIIKVPEELVDEDHPLLDKPFDAVKYHEFCVLAKSQGVALTLENLCGVKNFWESLIAVQSILK